jgi:nicotinamidase/pyrazinamidase
MASAVPRPFALGSGDALIVVHVQRDFLPGGSLAVPTGAEVVPVLNRCVERFHRAGRLIMATRDWHPAGHCSFREQGGPWPAHCVIGTPGSAFAPELTLPPSATIISSGSRMDREAYSGFQETQLHQRLQAAQITRVFVGGLATEYCVLHTVKDALGLGYAVVLLVDAIRAVNLKPDDGRRAEDEMIRLGAVPIRAGDLADDA